MAERNVTPGNLPNLRPGTIVLIVTVVVTIILLLNSFFIVTQQEEGVVLFLGKYSKTVDAGMNFKIPLLEKSFNVPTKVVQKEEFGFRTESAGIQTQYSSADFPQESEMLTGDLNIIDVEWVIQYRIDDPVAWLFNVDDSEVEFIQPDTRYPGRYEIVKVDNRIKTIRDISQSVINQLIGDRTILDSIGPERLSIEIQGMELMNEALDKYELGVKIMQVQLQNIVPPSGAVQAAFEDVNIATQDMNRLINEGREQYNREIPKAQGQKEQVIQVAEGYKTKRINQANGDVSRFNAVLKEYRKSPTITKTRLYYEMIEEIFSQEGNVDLIDKNLENFLPMKNLGTSGGQQ